MNRCAICSSHQVTLLGSLKPYLDYTADIYECHDCQSYFSRRDEEIYEELHQDIDSSYCYHGILAQEVIRLIRDSDLEGVYRKLSESRENSFIIDTILNNPSLNNILEFGCSRGYLGSYFIELGYKYIGIDISPTAVNEARKNFGNYFFCSLDPEIVRRKPFDAIYHIGTIGCVTNPIDFIRYNLSLLKKGGFLLFNAPNVNACKIFNDIWVTQTSPPDLVTLFHPDFWKKYFGSDADIYLTIAPERTSSALKKIWRVLRTGSALRPPEKYLFSSANFNIHEERKTGKKYQLILSEMKKVVLGIAKWIMHDSIPAEFGILVTIRKK